METILHKRHGLVIINTKYKDFISPMLQIHIDVLKIKAKVFDVEYRY